MEIGSDRLFRFNGGRFYAGGLIGVGRSDTTGDAYDSGQSDNQQVGAYGTWIFDNGFYVDTVARYFWFHRDYQTLQTGGDGI